MPVLVDTDVFSYIFDSRSPLAEQYQAHLRNEHGGVCFITIGELYAGARQKAWGRRRVAKLEATIQEFALVRIDLAVCQAYADLKTQAKTPQGSDRVTSDNDLWIAACAIRHDIPLLSNNRWHFEGLPGLQLISEAP